MQSINRSLISGWILGTVILGSACSPVRQYAKVPDVVAWNADIRKFEHLDSVERYSPKAILFVGSSSIRLWSTLARDMEPYPVIQRGYGGAKLSDMAVYARRIIYPHPCLAIVGFVANDISGAKDDKTPEEVDRLFRFILKTIRKRDPATPVFWIATTPTPLRWQVWPQIRQANELIQKSCEREKNTYFINTDFAFLNRSGYPRGELFRSDSLHLNAQGYALWTKLIKAQLNEKLGH